MLEHLVIKNFAIIEDLDVEFTSGFLALTGETGAGKSIIIDALSLLMGERSSFDKIRADKQKAYIEGSFRIDNQKLIEYLKNELDDEIEDNLLIISRTLDISNKSTIKINNRTVTLSTLKKISNLLLDIHSQQKDASYLQEENQLNLLDEYISKSATEEEINIFNEYEKVYSEYENIKHKLKELKDKQNDLGSLDYLTYQANELEKANIQENEMEDLEDEKNRLSSFLKMTERLQSFIEEYKNASTSLYNAKKQLSYINDDEFAELSEKFNDQYYALEDIYETISQKFDTYSESLNRLDQISERLYLLHSLRKKYGYTTEDILNKYEEIKASIDDIANFESKQDKLESDLKALTSAILSVANKLTIIRKKYAEKLSNEVNQQLLDLYLNNAEFKCDISSLDDFDEKGLDKVIFLLKANAGSNFLSLSKTASLGETSRLNLALKTVFNNLNPKDTIIFDEIDIGISGRVAIAVAKKMKLISKISQVIVISHLAQVCANADKHYFVSKEVKDNKTYSNIRLLSEKEHIEEIAKMMSGEEINQTTLKAAKELVNSYK